jgi:hypothetical protein
MSTKLTLTIEDAVIRQAKAYARRRGQSLSGIVENYLKAISSGTEPGAAVPDPAVRALRGSFKAPASTDYKKELGDALAARHLAHEADPD